MNSNKKKIIIVIAVILVIIVFLINNIDIIAFQNEYERVVDKIDNKESFNLLLMKDNDENIIKTLDYYSEVYNVKYEKVNINLKNKHFKKIVNTILIDSSYYDNNIFIVMKNGRLDSYVVGYLGEKAYRSFLINNRIIGKEYKKVDVLVKNPSDIDYKDDKLYNILFIKTNNKYLNEYRKILVQNKTKSFVVIVDNLNQIYAEKKFKEQIKFDNNADLPVLIKVKKKQVIYSRANITLADLEKNTKQINKK